MEQQPTVLCLGRPARTLALLLRNQARQPRATSVGAKLRPIPAARQGVPVDGRSAEVCGSGRTVEVIRSSVTQVFHGPGIAETDVGIARSVGFGVDDPPVVVEGSLSDEVRWAVQRFDLRLRLARHPLLELLPGDRGR